jgi:hypothetical protein
MGGDPERLARDLEIYRGLTREHGRPPGAVSVMRALPTDAGESRELLDHYEALGVERIICALRYETVEDYRLELDRLAVLI